MNNTGQSATARQTEDVMPPEWPYAENAGHYLQRGWSPVPADGKQLVVTGVSGKGGKAVTKQQVGEWCVEFGGHNIALVLSDGVVGIDVDHYDKKRGGDTLAERIKEWGELPATWISTSRSDGKSGICLYRVPRGTILKTVAGPAIEVVQHHHRYVMASPSVHPDTGEPYRWFDLDGAISEDGPSPKALAELPKAWVAGLRDTAPQRPTGSLGSGKKGSRALREGMKAGDPDSQVRGLLGQALIALSGQDGSRHDAVCRVLAGLLRVGELGAVGVNEAIEALKPQFVATVGASRSGGEREAAAEFDSMLATGAQMIADDPIGVAGDKPKSKVTLRKASEFSEKALEWLWPGHLAYGHLAELIGDSNTGKSLIAETDFPMRVTRGLPFPGEDQSLRREPGNVLITATEDGFTDVALPRLIAAGADLERIFLFELKKDQYGEPVGLTLPDRAADLRAAVEQAKADYLVISPISAYLSESIKSQVDASVRRALSPLVRIAADNRLAVVLVRHPNKNREMQAVDRGSGSGAFTQLVRSSFGVGKHPEEDGAHVFSRIANNLAAASDNPSMSYRIESSSVRPDQPAIQWGAAVTLTADDVMSSSTQDGRKRAPARDGAEAALREFKAACDVKDTPEGSRAHARKDEAYDYVMNRANVSKDTVRAACKNLGIESVPVRTTDNKAIDHWELQWPVRLIKTHKDNRGDGGSSDDGKESGADGDVNGGGQGSSGGDDGVVVAMPRRGRRT